MVAVSQAGLKITEDRAEEVRCEEPRSERTGRVVTDRRQLPQGGSGRRRYVAELPADLIADSLWSVGCRQASGFGRVRGGAQGMRTHMRDGRGLSGSARSRRRCVTAHITRGRLANETTADLLCDAELAISKGAGPGDRIAGATVSGSFCLEQSEHSFWAVSGRRDDPPVGLAQRLWRSHKPDLPSRLDAHACVPRGAGRRSAPRRHTCDEQSRSCARLALG